MAAPTTAESAQAVTWSTAKLRAEPPTAPTHLLSTTSLWDLVTPTLLPAKSKQAVITNWGRSFVVRPEKVFGPTTVAQCCAILELARREHKQVRSVGRAHSPSDLMMTSDWAILMKGVSGTLDITAGSEDPPTATFLAGTFISDINEILRTFSPPLAMSSLGSISEQSIGGLIATATHGSGYGLPTVSALVQELDVAVPLPDDQGGVQIVRCSRRQNPELFNATLCGLGATGLVTTVKVQVEPAFRLRHLVEDCDVDWLFGKQTGWPAVEVPRWQTQPDLPSPVPAEQASSTADAPVASPKSRVSIGQLVAEGKPLPPVKRRYLASRRDSSAAEIWPLSETDDAHMSRASNSVVEDDEDDDEATRSAQKHLEQIIQSSEHTRIWWFHQVGMCTVSRANRTLEPPVGPTLGQRVYHNVVGYHFEQFLLYIARYNSSLPPRVAKLMYRLTHSRYPPSLRAGGGDETAGQSTPSSSLGSISESTVASSTDVSSSASTLAKEFAGFEAGPSPSIESLQSSQPQSSLRPLRASHPHSYSVDHSHNVFNMDCLFPQYTTEWCIPYTCTAAFLRALRDWLQVEVSRGNNVHFPIEIRWTDADGIWLSHGQGRKNCYVGLMQYRPYNQPVPYRDHFAKFERIARYFGGRPHWAKTHTCGPLELATLYPHIDEWKRVRDHYDPQGILLNPYVQRHIYGHVSEDTSVRRFKTRQQGKL